MPDPVFRIWTEKVVHIVDCEIVPVAEYEVEGCKYWPPPDDKIVCSAVKYPVSTGIKPLDRNYGDMCGRFSKLCTLDRELCAQDSDCVQGQTCVAQRCSLDLEDCTEDSNCEQVSRCGGRCTVDDEPCEVEADCAQIPEPQTCDQKASKPDGFVNIQDLTGFLKAIGAIPGAPHISWVDLWGPTCDTCDGPPNTCVVPQQIMDVGDLQRVLFGLEGQTYEQSPGQVSPGDCPD